MHHVYYSSVVCRFCISPAAESRGQVFGHVGLPTVFLSGSEQSSHTSSQFSTCATPYVNTEPHVRRHSCRQPVTGSQHTLSRSFQKMKTAICKQLAALQSCSGMLCMTWLYYLFIFWLFSALVSSMHFTTVAALRCFFPTMSLFPSQ